MTVEFLWQLPTRGDARPGNAEESRRGERTTKNSLSADVVSDPRGRRFNYFDYIHQVARAAELSGFDGVQIPDDLNGEEPWIVAGYISRATRRVKLLTGFDASRGSAVYAAKNAVSFQRFTRGRLAWQIGVGGDDAERRQRGDFLDPNKVSERIGEFLTVARGVIGNTSFSFKGDYFEVFEGGFRGPLSQQPIPQAYLGGSDDNALILSAESADVHVFDAEPIAGLASRIALLNEFALAAGREVRAGLRIDVIARETEAEARFDAARHLEQSNSPVNSAEGPVWFNLTRSASGAHGTVVGSYGQVTEGLAAYAKLGIRSFLLAAPSHLEEAYRVGEHILPALRKHPAIIGREAA